ncbi:hypothetical protein EPN29_14165 [bacterium]|nr:MAG: hypothetical protein EPN29_14165 [bacterium]
MSDLPEKGHFSQIHDEEIPKNDHWSIYPKQGSGRLVFSFPGRPGGIASSGENSLIVSDFSSGDIWQIDLERVGAIFRLVPAGIDGKGQFHQDIATPAGLAFAFDGSIYLADSARHRISAVSPDGSFRVVAGGANGYRDGPAGEAMFSFPLDVALASDGSCYVADSGNDRIRLISPDGYVTTLAGSIYDYGDGCGPDARLRRPGALEFNSLGTCYVADTGNNVIRGITPDGQVTTFAGDSLGGDQDGKGPEAGMRWPTGIAVGSDDSVWVADHGNGAVRRITADGASATVLRLHGRRWPTAVAAVSDSKVAIAYVAFDQITRPQAHLMILDFESD